ncbi:MAG: hypothetical protein GXY83_26780 [Rhodopirellula sp.]|nr:hypothetical protein [Rhodopirellula sp.]
MPGKAGWNDRPQSSVRLPGANLHALRRRTPVRQVLPLRRLVVGAERRGRRSAGGIGGKHCEGTVGSLVRCGRYPHASTVAYSNLGGFLAPEIRFAGYDGILVRGRADNPVYLYVNDGRVELRDARKFWGMGTDRCDRALTQELGDRRFQTCAVGPAGENLVP